MAKRKKMPRWTSEQRQWFHRRDRCLSGKTCCQFVDFSRGEAVQCKKYIDIEVHHIIGFYYARKVLRGPEEKVNNPENGICLCKRCHNERIHPDIGFIARKMYRYTPDSYKIVLRQHKFLAKHGIPYWWTQFDQTLTDIAKARTRAFLKANPNDPFPTREHKENKQ